MASSEELIVWLGARDGYVKSMPNITLRIKPPSRMGENTRGCETCAFAIQLAGFREVAGELCTLSWQRAQELAPTCMEIVHARNPMPTLFGRFQEHTLRRYLSELRSLSIFEESIGFDELLEVLRRLNALHCFAYADWSVEPSEWTRLAEQFNALGLKALDASGGKGCVEHFLARLNVVLLRLCGNPGFKVAELARSAATFTTVEVLVVSDLCIVREQDPDDFLRLIPAKFPSLKCLVWDWSVIDPALVFDERTKAVLPLVLNAILNLDAFAIICYTPCAATKSAASEVAAQISKAGAHEVRWKFFATKGVPEDKPNFSFIIGGPSVALRLGLETAFLENRQSVPELRHLFAITEPDTSMNRSSLVVDFGGFDKALIQHHYYKDNTAYAT